MCNTHKLLPQNAPTKILFPCTKFVTTSFGSRGLVGQFMNVIQPAFNFITTITADSISIKVSITYLSRTVLLVPMNTRYFQVFYTFYWNYYAVKYMFNWNYVLLILSDDFLAIHCGM